MLEIAAALEDGVKFTAGASAGMADCGDLGRSFAVVSPAVNESMQRLNKDFKTTNDISGVMLAEANLDFILRARDVVHFTRSVTDANPRGNLMIVEV